MRYRPLLTARLLSFLLVLLLSACGGGGAGEEASPAGNNNEQLPNENPDISDPTPVPDNTSDALAHACIQGSWSSVSQNLPDPSGGFSNPLITPPTTTPQVTMVIAGLQDPLANNVSTVNLYQGDGLRIWQQSAGFFQDTYSPDWSILFLSVQAGSVEGFFTTQDVCTQVYQAGTLKSEGPACSVNQLYQDESEITLDCSQQPATMTLQNSAYSVNYTKLSSDTSPAVLAIMSTPPDPVDPEPEPEPEPTDPDPVDPTPPPTARPVIGDDVLAGFVQTSSANDTWASASDEVLSGIFSLKSAEIDHLQNAEIEISGEYLAGEFSFAYKVSSEAEYDVFSFYLDNQLVIETSGEVDWTLFSQNLSAGFHRFRWLYKKDQVISQGDDAVWIDEVIFPPVNTQPQAGLNLEQTINYISAGDGYYGAVRADGSLWAWGFNYYGYIGNGSSGSQNDDIVTTPVQVQDITNVVAVESYNLHTLALNADGKVWSWGLNSHGQLGDGLSGELLDQGGAVYHNPNPAQVEGLDNIVQIAAGTYHSVALRRDGRIFAWGANWSGQLGDGTYQEQRTPVLVEGIDRVVQISAGLFVTLALRDDGSVWIWGSSSSLTNTYSSLGVEGLFETPVPVRIPNLDSVIQIESGGTHHFALLEDGTVWGWGSNVYGRLGDGTTTNTTAPVHITGLSNVKTLAAENNTSMALTHDGDVWIWGYNDYQRLCTGLSGSHHSPTKVPISNVAEISPAMDGYLVLTQGGDLLACGSNSYGALATQTQGIVSELEPVMDEFGSGTFHFHGDRDNDGVKDNIDDFPDDASETVDTDKDGIGDNADTDDDGDGSLDADDAFPLDASEQVDADNDGIGDNTDTDDDNDGTDDVNDAYPLDPARQNPNSNPVMSGTPSSNVNEDSLYNYTPTVTDTDANESTSFSIDNKPVWASFNTNSGALSGTPTNDHVGIFSNIKITVTDIKGGIDDINFSITVNNTNDAPGISGSPNTQINEDSSYSFIPAITDIDIGDSHSFSIINKPSWASFNTITGELSGTPLNSHVALYSSIQITVTDFSGASDSLLFNITVNNTNDAPIISGTPNTQVNEDTAYSFIPNVSDVDAGDSKIFSINNKPGWASFNTGTGELYGTPVNANNGSYNNIVITVTDSASSSDSLASFNLTVVAVNDAPILNSATAISVNENETAIGYTVSASDEENDTITYSISGGNDANKFSLNNGVLSFSSAPNYESPLDNGSNNTYVVNLTATDNGSPNRNDTLILTVTVLNVNEFAPVFSSGTTHSRQENVSTVAYTATATDADTDNISFSVSGGLDQSRFNISSSGTLNFSFTPNFESPIDSNGDNIYVVEITATDNGAIPMATSLTLAVTVLNVIEVTSTGVGLKTVSLDWDSHVDASYYKLFYYDQGTTSALTKIGGNITATEYVAPIYNHKWAFSNTFYIVEAYNSSNVEIPSSSSNAFRITDFIAMGDPVGFFKASNNGGSDQFGYSVAVSGDGNTMVVGALLEDSNATTINGTQTNNSNSAAGAAYVYINDGTSWSQQAYLKASDSVAAARFGTSVAISDDGDDIVVGATGNQKAYVFTRSGTSWTQQASFQGSDISSNNNYGQSVSMSDDGARVAVGAVWQGVSVAASGAAYIFDRVSTTWSETVKLKASNPDTGDYYGQSVALSGDGSTLAVGAKGEDSNITGIDGTANDSGNDSGAIYVYHYASSTWSEQGFIKASTYTASVNLGSVVSINDDGSVVAAGASTSFASKMDVYIFNRISGTWFEQGTVVSANAEDGDNFGYTLTLDASGTQLVASSFYESSDALNINGDDSNNLASFSGAVYYFKYSGSSWSQSTYIKAPNTNANDTFGSALSLSDDGNTLAVGAMNESSNATSVSTGADTDMDDNSNTSSGAVYLY